MADQVLQLTYRELADRLGSSPDAARMKAKRRVKAGRWNIIPGNHPNDPVRVEMPADDLPDPERVGTEQTERVGRGTNARTNPEYSEQYAREMLVALQSAQERIQELTDQLGTEKDLHRETAMARAQAETVQASLVLDIQRLEADLQAARRTWWQRLKGDRER